ncbi:hypothetical protein JYT84_00420 [bacterium AH-315-M10]|nr:hypothetical protein [bacterium AH-315-M10]
MPPPYFPIRENAYDELSRLLGAEEEMAELLEVFQQADASDSWRTVHLTREQGWEFVGWLDLQLAIGTIKEADEVKSALWVLRWRLNGYPAARFKRYEEIDWKAVESVIDRIAASPKKVKGQGTTSDGAS